MSPLDPIVRQNGLPLWRQVASRLIADIRGRGDGDDRLPSEQELARRFGVNRHTIRQALRALADQGLVRAEQGRGTFLARRRIDYAIGARTRFTANLLAQERSPSREVLEASMVAAGPAVADALHITVDSLVHRVRSLVFADGVPIGVGDSHLAPARFADVAARLEGRPSITALFASYGIEDYRRRSTRIHARLIEAGEAVLLRHDKHATVLVSEGVDVDPADAPIAYSITVWSAERVQFSVET